MTKVVFTLSEERRCIHPIVYMIIQIWKCSVWQPKCNPKYSRKGTFLKKTLIVYGEFSLRSSVQIFNLIRNHIFEYYTGIQDYRGIQETFWTQAAAYMSTSSTALLNALLSVSITGLAMGLQFTSPLKSCIKSSSFLCKCSLLSNIFIVGASTILARRPFHWLTTHMLRKFCLRFLSALCL